MRRSALSPPPDDLVSLVEQAALEKILQRPPHALHEALVVRDVGLLQIDPKADPLGQPFPLLHVAPDTFLALVDKRFDAVGFDLFFAVDAQFFTDFHFDRQAVRVPAGFASHRKPRMVR